MSNIPYDDKMFLGVGYNSLTGRVLVSPFEQVELYSPSGVTGQKVEAGIYTVTSTRDLSKKLNFGFYL